MVASDKYLEALILEYGNWLVKPPWSVDELLPLLDRVESCLSKIDQSPSESMRKALSPSLKALISDTFLGHSDVDVRVAVASCISEITRITAPDAPYDDDQMKKVFQLVVSSFENLCDKSSRSYTKRASILETVAKVRSCTVMLDLECDALIVEMFEHFLKAIRDYHPEIVYSSMETIMILVLEESEDIPVGLLIPILDTVKIDNRDVLPIARKLGERVLETCAAKVKPYLVMAVKDLDISLHDYSKVVSTICQDAIADVEQNEVQASDGNMAVESRSMKPLIDEEREDQMASEEGLQKLCIIESSIPILKIDEVSGNLNNDAEISKTVKIELDDIEEEVNYWRTALVCYVLGANPRIQVMEGFFHRVWKDRGIDKVSLLTNGVFIVRFFTAEDRDKVIKGGHVFFDKKPLIMKPWNERERYCRETLNKIPVWIQIANLEVKYWGDRTMRKILGPIGHLVKQDNATCNRERLEYARVLLEVNLGQELPEQISFDNEYGDTVSLSIYYEWKPVICQTFTKLGRAREKCRKKNQQEQ